MAALAADPPLLDEDELCSDILSGPFICWGTELAASSEMVGGHGGREPVGCAVLRSRPLVPAQVALSCWRRQRRDVGKHAEVAEEPWGEYSEGRAAWFAGSGACGWADIGAGVGVLICECVSYATRNCSERQAHTVLRSLACLECRTEVDSC